MPQMSRLRQNFCSCLLSSFSSFFQLSFNNQHGTVIFICLPMKHLGVLKNSRPSRSIWNLELLVFEEREKSEYPEKNFSDNKVENKQQTQLTHIWYPSWDLDLGHIGGGRVLSPLHHCWFPV